MRLSIPTSWDNKLITGVTGLPVTDVYGKLARDVVGGARYPYWLPHVSGAGAEAHIKLARDAGIAFNYVINATCLGGEEKNPEYRRSVIELLDWINDQGVEIITVSSVWLLRLAKELYPRLRVATSAFQQVRSLEKAKQFEALGADIITIQDANRDFRLLESLRQGLNCDIQMVVNNSCIFNCPFEYAHGNTMSHSSQTGHRNNGYVVDTAVFACANTKFADPVELIRSRWIRPEDLKTYEDIGLDHFKLVDRNMPTDRLIEITKAYAARRWDGDLLDLLVFPPRDFPLKFGTPHRFRYFLRNWRQANPLKLLSRVTSKVSESVDPISIDNNQLDGFLEHFRNIDCAAIDCDTCGYCRRVADQVMTIDETVVRDQLKAYDEIRHNLTDGKIF